MEHPIKKKIKGIDVYYILSDKFKTITWSLNFLHHPGQEKINEYYILSNLLQDEMKHYPTNELKYRYLSSLYGLEAYSSAKNIGDHIFNQFVITYPNERYIEGEESLSYEAFRFMLDMILHPKMRNHNFTKKALKDNLEEAKELFSLIKSMKDMHAYYRYSEVYYQDKKDLQYNFPDKERLQQVTLSSLKEAYDDFFLNDQISLYVTGNIEEKKIDEIIDSLWPDVFKNHPFPLQRKAFDFSSIMRPKTVKEYDDVSQSRVFLGYRTDVPYMSDAHALMAVMNEIFGGFEQSLLFMEIREQANLAYFVESSYLSDEQMIVVSVSCDVLHQDRVIQMIKDILQNIIAGAFSDELLMQAKASCINSLYSIHDAQAIYLLQHMKSFMLFNQRYDLEDRVSLYQNATKADVIDMAKRLQLDTVYMYTLDEEKS